MDLDTTDTKTVRTSRSPRPLVIAPLFSINFRFRTACFYLCPGKLRGHPRSIIFNFYARTRSNYYRFRICTGDTNRRNYNIIFGDVENRGRECTA